MSEWQDISTAPKDGTRILVYGPDGHDIAEYEVWGQWVRRATAEYDNEGMVVAAPTHWMPLLPPPVSS